MIDCSLRKLPDSLLTKQVHTYTTKVFRFMQNSATSYSALGKRPAVSKLRCVMLGNDRLAERLAFECPVATIVTARLTTRKFASKAILLYLL